MSDNKSNIINLPSPFFTGGLPLAEAVSQRRSIRVFSPKPILLFQISQILWAAQGITHSEEHLKAIPSAGATYPLEIYAIVGEGGIENTDSGIYHYEAESHALSLHLSGDIRAELANAALGQDFISVAPVSLVICAVYDRTLMRYSNRGERYVYIEAGHAGQNIYLQAAGVGLGTVAIGAFRDNDVRDILNLDSRTRPIYIMPLGKPSQP